jgi:NADH-quinone oxidoreductase subunit F
MGAWDDKMNLTCFEPLKLERSWTLQTYQSIGGYDAWKKILTEKTPREQIIEHRQSLGAARSRRRRLPGRREVELHAAQRHRCRKYVVCNS